MASIVLVHGISVRGDDYHRMYGLVKKNLTSHVIVPCLWGDDFGTKFSTKGLSVPRVGDSSIDDDNTSSEDDEATGPGSELWDVLYEDPLYELAILRTRPAKLIAVPPGFTALDTWAARVKALPENKSLEAELEPLSISPSILRGAVARLFDPCLPECRDAIERHGANEDLLAPAISRSIVSVVATHLRPNAESLPIDTNEWRTDAAQSINFALVGEAKGFVTDFLGPPIIRFASRAVRARRSKVTNAIAPFVGDVLTYLARGEEIRRFLSDCIKDVEPPVVLLAHSLGGMVCIEYLAELLRKRETTKVESVVTVGSQSGLLYEFNALPTFPLGSIPATLPERFPRWLNIWHRSDLLAYLAKPIFKNSEAVDNIEDVEVHSKHEFPESHSAYWENPDVYKQILRHIS